MARKILFTIFAVIVLCLCCGICFAAEDNSSINLGNEIMQSIDKTGNSMQDAFSGNMIDNAGNEMRNGVDDVRNGVDNMGNDTRKTVDGVLDQNSTGNYNTTRTTTEGSVSNGEVENTMSTTTWMWIILVVAAVIIIAAIWYYATKNS